MIAPDLLALAVIGMTALTLALAATFVTVASAHLGTAQKIALLAGVWLVPFIVPLIVLARLSKKGGNGDDDRGWSRPFTRSKHQ